MPVTITRCHARVNMTKGGRSQQHSGICIQQGGNRAGKQKVIWSCPSEVIWRRYAEQLLRQIFASNSPPRASGLKVFTGWKTSKWRDSIWQGHNGQGSLEGEKPESEPPPTLFLYTAHTSCSMVLIFDAAFPGGWLADFSTRLIILRLSGRLVTQIYIIWVCFTGGLFWTKRQQCSFRISQTRFSISRLEVTKRNPIWEVHYWAFLPIPR